MNDLSRVQVLQASCRSKDLMKAETNEETIMDWSNTRYLAYLHQGVSGDTG